MKAGLRPARLSTGAARRLKNLLASENETAFMGAFSPNMRQAMEIDHTRRLRVFTKWLIELEADAKRWRRQQERQIEYLKENKKDLE